MITRRRPSSPSVAFATSANGLVVGKSKLKVSGVMVDRAFILSNVGSPGAQPMLNLTDRSAGFVGGNWVPAAQLGWTLISAERINPAGWIVGYGTLYGQTRGFILAPRWPSEVRTPSPLPARRGEDRVRGLCLSNKTRTS